jgi:hypothetical protein
MQNKFATLQDMADATLPHRITLIGTTNHALINAMSTKKFANLPENQPAIDFHHPLQLKAGFFADSSQWPISTMAFTTKIVT